MSEPQYLLRMWGGDLAEVKALKQPDAYEPDDHVACYWFQTREEREAFIESMRGVTRAMRDRVDPGMDRDGEMIDTRSRTVAIVTLRLPNGDTHTFETNFGYGYPESAAHSMFESGNYSCDCNKRLMLARQCGVGTEEEAEALGCGDAIELVNLEIKHVPADV